MTGTRYEVTVTARAIHADDDDPVEVAEKNDDGDGQEPCQELAGAEAKDVTVRVFE